MARTASVAIGGFYPTPEHLLPSVSQLVTFLPGEHRVFDPCAGEGVALYGLTEIWSNAYPNFKSDYRYPAWGCEMEATRFKKLRKNHVTLNGDRVDFAEKQTVHGDCFCLNEGKLTKQFSVLYLNPPYDLDPVVGRLEEKFLRRFVHCLADGGVLFFVVPHYALESSVETLATHFEEFQCYAFPEADFKAYKQVVLVGKKRPMLPLPHPLWVEQLKQWSKSVQGCPVLGTVTEGTQIKVLPLDKYSHPTLHVKPVDVVSLVNEFQPWRSTDRRGKLVDLPGAPVLKGVEDVLSHSYPMLMPPKVAHISMAIASGIFNGSVVAPDNPDSHLPSLLVKGVFDKEWEKETGSEKTNKQGEVVAHKERQKAKLVVTVFDMKWQQFHTLKFGTTATANLARVEDMNMADLMDHYGKNLIHVMMRQCPVTHDPSNDNDRFPLAPLKRTLFRAQEEAVRANVKILGGPGKALSLRNRYAFVLGELGSGKSFTALATAATIKARKVLVVCPPHLLAEWQSEVPKSLDNASVTVLTDVKVLDDWATHTPQEGHMSVGVVSRETAKLGHGWVGAGEHCPRCGGKTPPVDLAKKRVVCEHTSLEPKESLGHTLKTAVASALALSPGNISFLKLLGSHTKAPKNARNEVTQKDRDNLRPVFLELKDRVLKLIHKGSSFDPFAPHLMNFLVAMGSMEEFAQTAIDFYAAAKGDSSYYGVGESARKFANRCIFAFKDSDTRAFLIGLLQQIPGVNLELMPYYSRKDPWATVIALHDHLCEGGSGKSYNPDLPYEVKDYLGWGYNPHEYMGSELGSRIAIVTALETLYSNVAWKTSAPCGERLYQAVADPRRYPLAKYLLRRHPDCFDMLIVDEFHEAGDAASAQSKAIHRLVELGKPLLMLTGTSMNGYASSLFANLWACNRRFREEFERSEETAFVDRYGYRTRVVETKEKERKTRDHGMVTDRVTSERVVGEAAGVVPVLVLKWLLPYASTIHKRDLGIEIPGLTQERVAVHPTPQMDAEIKRLARALIEQVKKDRFDEDLAGKLFGAMAHLPSYLDLCTTDTGNQEDGSYQIRYPESCGGELVTEGLSFSPATLLPKEAWMVETVRKELAEGRKVMIFAWHKPLLARYKRILEQQLCEEVALLDPAKVGTAKRRAWIDKEVVSKNRRVLVVNPQAIQTGLNNLVSFATILVMENPACNPTVYRQAVGRIDRIGQQLETRVVFPVYESTLQATAHKLLMAKVAVSQSVDGLDASGSIAASGGGDAGVEMFASMSLGKALAQMYAEENGLLF